MLMFVNIVKELGGMYVMVEFVMDLSQVQLSFSAATAKFGIHVYG